MKFKKIKMASILGIIGNLFLLIIKGIVGIITGSKAMLADSLNSASDIFSSIMTFIGNKIASVPSDDDHNLGHGKAEYIYSLLISIVMILVALFTIKDTIFSLINKNVYKFNIFLIIVCIVTIIVKFSLFLYTNSIYKRYHSLLIKANSKDHLNDCILTFLNLISIILSYYGVYFVDGIVGIIIASFILITGIKIYRESYDVLMDKSISIETKKKVLDIIGNYDEIKKINHFNSTPVGYKYQISFTIFVDGNLSTFDSHKIADSLEKEISNKIDDIYLTVIHVNPI